MSVARSMAEVLDKHVTLAVEAASLDPDRSPDVGALQE